MSIETLLTVCLSPLLIVSLFRFLLTIHLLLAYEVALGTTTLIRPYLAKTLLGWQPRKPGLVDGLPIYYAAWLAAQHQ